MKSLRAIIGILTLGIFLSAANAQEKTEVRKVSDFSGIKVSESIDVELSMGDANHVEVMANEEIIDRVATEVKGGVLVIHITGNSWNGWNNKVRVKVTAKNINLIKTSSSSSLKSTNTIQTENIELSSSSSADLKVLIKAQKVSCNASSSSDIIIKGSTKYFEATASSSADIHANELKAEKVKAKASSSATINTQVSNDLYARASSSADINYSGSPKLVDIDQSSSGKVRKK